MSARAIVLMAAAAAALSAQTARHTGKSGGDNPSPAPAITQSRSRARNSYIPNYPVLQPGQTPQLVIDPSVDQSQIDLPGWFNLVWPIVTQIAEPGPQTAAQYKLEYIGVGDDFGTVPCTGPTTFNAYPIPGYKELFTLSPYFDLTYELHHFIQPCSVFASSVNLELEPFEARSEAGESLVDRTLWRQSPSQYSFSTSLVYLDVLNNLYADAVGGGGAYGELDWPIESGGQIELLYSVFGGSLKPFDHAWNTANSQAEMLSNLDATGKTVNGVLPSTFLQYSLSTYAGGPQGGAYFSILPWGLPTTIYQTGFATRDGEGPVNPNAFIMAMVQRNPDDIFPINLAGTALWRITDSTGIVWHQDVSSSYPSSLPLFDTSSLPEGAYRVDGCVLKAGSTTACDPTINTETLYFLVSSDPSWWQDSLFLIGNGPDYFTLDASQEFTILDDGGAESTSRLPGLLVLQNPQRDVVVSFAGNPPRTFTPGDLSTVYLATRRDQPHLYTAGNAASANSSAIANIVPQVPGTDGVISPGSWVTLFTWGATQLDPYLPAGGALPTEGCADGRTRVDFQTPDGADHWAPIQYCSRGQINAQAPYELSGQTAATAYVVLGATRSNGVPVQIAPLDPAFFIGDWGTVTPAMYDVTAGTVVAAGAPVQRGDWISFYATGLGPTSNDPATAQLAAGSPLPQVVNPVNLLVGSALGEGSSPGLVALGGNPLSIPATWAGLDPGFVGLYQVNVQIPRSIAPGSYYVELSQGTAKGNIATLTIQ